MRLGLFLAVGVLIQAYFTATIQGGSWLNSIAGFFNIKFPDTLPEWLTKLFTTGYNGIAFWQILQVTAILLEKLADIVAWLLLRQMDLVNLDPRDHLRAHEVD